MYLCVFVCFAVEGKPSVGAVPVLHCSETTQCQVLSSGIVLCRTTGNKQEIGLPILFRRAIGSSLSFVCVGVGVGLCVCHLERLRLAVITLLIFTGKPFLPLRI